MKAVALDLDSFTGGGQTAIGDLAEAVRRVRGAGKPVVAYSPAIPTTAISSPRRLRRSGSTRWARVAIAGPGGSNLYYKGLLDKLGVTANVYRVGTYKSAVEPFIRNDMSPEAKENYLALDRAELDSWRTSVQQARPKAKVDLFLQDMNGAVRAAGGDMAKAALAGGPGRPHRRPAGSSRRGSPSSAAKARRRTARATAGSSSAPTVPTRSTAAPRARSASSPSPA